MAKNGSITIKFLLFGWIIIKRKPNVHRRPVQQQYPDKQKQKNGDDGSSGSRVEEVNARFAKIAEAYQVLSEKGKKM